MKYPSEVHKNFAKTDDPDNHELIRKVRSVKMNGNEINVSDLKSGNYYFEITLKDGSTSFEQLIKE
ncbi:hypothetical protein [Chryseobacterium wanjuense]